MSNDNKDDSTSYQGNRNLKPRNIIVPFTADEVNEYIKCMDDPIYFIRNYLKIVNLDRGVVNFDLYKFQEQIIKNMMTYRNNLIKTSRQSGKTSTISGYSIHQALFKDNYSILIAANKARTAFEIMKRIKEMYQNLPKWLQQGVTTWNAGSVEFENGSRIIAIPTTSDAARGMSINSVVLDEFAFLPRNIADEFFTSVIPTISAGVTTKITVISTPKGLNHFYDLWEDATKREEQIKSGEIQEDARSEGRFHPFETNWYDVPGRDEIFKQKMLDSFGGDYTRWEQEFAAQFIGSSNTLLNSSTVKRLKEIRQLPIAEPNQSTKIYKEAVPGHTYMICLDTAEGKGLDYHAATVTDVTNNPFEVVATFHDNKTPTELVPHVIMNLGKIYNEAYILVETRSLGSSVAYNLYYDLEYPNMLAAKPNGRAGLSLTMFNKEHRGLSTSNASRSIGCDRLKVLLETEQLRITDKEIIDELANFVLSKGKYQADSGHHDDFVMTLVMLGWASTSPFFKELSTVDVKDAFKNKINELSTEFLPFGVILDSNEDFVPIPYKF